MSKLSKTRGYSIWSGMRRRCRDPKRDNYKYYGGRGIKVCPRWETFKTFIDDMGEPPPNHTLDRIDRDGNYEPSNCRWATKAQQANNTCLNLFIVYQNRRQTLAQWCHELNLVYETVKNRIYKFRWSVDNAFNIPIDVKKRAKRTNIQITFNGSTKNLGQWCVDLKLNYPTILARLKKGWSDEKALTQPLRKWPSQI